MDADGNRVEVTIQKKEDVSEAQQASEKRNQVLIDTLHMVKTAMVLMHPSGGQEILIQRFYLRLYLWRSKASRCI